MAYFSTLNDADRATALGDGLADASNGVLFTSDDGTKKPLSLRQQFLIIGVGGSGCKTVNMIKGDLNRQYSWNSNEVAFLAIDTDGGELASLPNLLPTEKYQIVDKPGIVDRYCKPGLRTLFTNTWIRPDFAETRFDDNGAGQNRVICHAKLFDQVDSYSADQELVRKISRVDAPFTDAKPTEVIIILGVAGGTGSGGLINIAHFAREALRLRHNIRITGYMYMPDVFSDAGVIVDSKKANGYAALKEMDYYYCAKQRKNADVLRSHGPAQVEVDYLHPLYDTVFLVSGSVYGTTVNPYKTATEAVKESITNLLTEDQNATAAEAYRRGITVPMFMMAQFSSNSETGRRNVIKGGYATDPVSGLLTGDERPKFFGEDVYNYNAIGVGKAAVPQELIKSYAVNQVVRNLLAVTATTRSGAAVAWNSGALTPTAGSAEINGLLTFTPAAVKTKIESIVRSCKLDSKEGITVGDEKQVERRLGLNVRRLQSAVEREIENAYTAFENNVKQFLKEYGPYTFKSMCNGIATAGPYNGLFRVLGQFGAATRDSEGLQTKKDNSDRALEPHRRNIASPIVRWIPSTKDGWIDAVVSKAKAEAAYEIAGGIFGPGQYYETHFLIPAKNLCEECCEFAEVLEGLTNTYGNLAHDFGDFTQYNTWLDNRATATVYDCIRSQADYKWAKEEVDNQLGDFHNSNVRDALVDDFMGNRQKWIECDLARPDTLPRSVLDTFMAPHVRFTSSINVTTFIQHQVAAEGTKMQEAVENLIVGLLNKSMPLFAADAGIVDMTSNLNRYLLVPSGIFAGADGAEVRAGFDAACAPYGISMQESAGVDSFVLYTQKGGLPICALGELSDWENAYNGMRTGYLHRNESGKGDFNPTDGLEWKNYPGLSHQHAPRTPDPTTGSLCAEGVFLRDQLDPLWDKAVKMGVIRERQDSSNKYYYEYFNLIHLPEWNLTFDQNNWPMNADNLFVKGDAMFKQFATMNGKSLQDITKTIRLENQGAFSEPNPKRENALDWAKRSLRKNVPMYLEVKKTVAKIEGIVQKIDSLNNATIARGLAAKYIACGILQEADANIHEWRLMDYPNKGASQSIAKLVPLAFASDGINKNRLMNGIVYPVLVSKFRCETANDANIGTFYLTNGLGWNNLTTSMNPHDVATAEKNLRGFAQEAQNFLAKYSPASATYARNTLMATLPGDNYGEIEECYKELLNLYNLVSVVSPVPSN